MRVLLLQLDGKIPNLALMRLAFHHRSQGDDVLFRVAGNERAVEPHFDESPDCVYASAIFLKTANVIRRCREVYPGCIIGGTGVDLRTNLEQYGVGPRMDYSIYPRWRQSIGFTQRGCRLDCDFCCVRKKEGIVQEVATIAELWRGDPWPREILLLDNDFFGQKNWRGRIREIRDGGFKVSFNQGINARCLSDEAAEAISSVEYRDDSMRTRRIYTAWDSAGDEVQLFNGLRRLVKYGVKPDHIMVYMLIGFWPGETHAARDYRRQKLREFGARPYPMPFARTAELMGFQRWVIGAYDKTQNKNHVTWDEWVAAKYQPHNLGDRSASQGEMWDGTGFAQTPQPVAP